MLLSLAQIILLICFFSLLISVNCELLSENVAIAINCGGESYKDSKGIIYEKDHYFSGGQSSDFGTNFEIKLTNDQDLYQTERWSSEDFSYDIPLPSPGKYILVLKFSEVYFNSPAEKIFNVHIGKEQVMKQIDIYSKVGKATAFDEYVEFELRNNKVYINNKSIEGAYDEDTGIFHIFFKKGERDNPKVNAILIVKGGLAETDYEQFKTQLEEFERQKLEKERKQREFQKVSKSADFEDFEDDFVDSQSYNEHGSYFLNIPTIIFLIVGIAVGYFFFLRKNEPVSD